MLTLSMIVRDEAAGILGTLDSCLGLIDRFDILDTGSTDLTAELIGAWGARNRIPGVVYRGNFVDFATTRNFALTLARESTWALLLSGDEMVTPTTKLREFLEQSTYLEHDARMRHGDLVYGQIRLVRPWTCGRYQGRTHERIVPRDLGPPAPIEIRGKPAWSRKKLLRDLCWLDQDTPRGMFYTAQTYQCLGEIQDAIWWYRARADWKTGDSDEWWTAILRAGELAQDPKYLSWAALERSWRAEPWYFLAQHARRAGHFVSAEYYLSTAEQCPVPKDRGPVDWRIRAKLHAERMVLGHARLEAERSSDGTRSHPESEGR